MPEPTKLLPCCQDWKPQTDKINSFIVLQALRSGNHSIYDGIPFRYCPWCGTILNATITPQQPPQSVSEIAEGAIQTRTDKNPVHWMNDAASNGIQQIVEDAILEGWNKVHKRMISGNTFSTEMRPIILNAITRALAQNQNEKSNL